jgi:hypothetical protein
LPFFGDAGLRRALPPDAAAVPVVFAGRNLKAHVTEYSLCLCRAAPPSLQAGDGVGETRQTFRQERSRATEIEAGEAFAAWAEARSGVESQACLVDEETLQFLRGESQGAEIQPRHIGALGSDVADGGKAFPQEFPEEVKAVFEKARSAQPWASPLALGDFEGEHAEEIAPSECRLSRCSCESTAQVRVRDDRQRRLQLPAIVEVLLGARRVTVRARLRGEGCQRDGA